jgi:heat shock protein HtpX
VSAFLLFLIALRRLDDEASLAPSADKCEVYAGVRRLCLLPHGFTETDPDDEEFHVEVQSHPPTDERVDRLGDVAAAMEK